ncbi:hypothetical protein Chor_001357, partial [Crotalus horridus]
AGLGCSGFLPPFGVPGLGCRGTETCHVPEGHEFNRSDGYIPKYCVADLTTDAVSVAIAAPPSEGEANTELCRYLSKVLEIKKNDVVLEKGSKSREKVVKILAPLTPEDVLEKLRKESSS